MLLLSTCQWFLDLFFESSSKSHLEAQYVTPITAELKGDGGPAVPPQSSQELLAPLGFIGLFSLFRNVIFSGLLWILKCDGNGRIQTTKKFCDL